jgi:hypothetical protein
VAIQITSANSTWLRYKNSARSFLDQLFKFELQGTWRETRSYSAMQRDIELIFPIKDSASAALITIKADCLHKAG